ncbi:MAG: hypothetical protein FWH14_02350, partial [Oscillospiraceae bacterium]|nr:hypothetical protein [Oscillospiraceae bacterium]
LEIIVCKPQFPSGEGCRRSGGVVCRGGNLPPVGVIQGCRDDRPRSSVVIANCYQKVGCGNRVKIKIELKQ